MTDNIKELPVKFKQPISEDSPSLEIVTGPGCSHLFTTYKIREGNAEVECGSCGERLNPMWVLSQIAKAEARIHQSRKAHQEEMKRLNDRKKTKCNHCGKMTAISKR